MQVESELKTRGKVHPLTNRNKTRTFTYTPSVRDVLLKKWEVCPESGIRGQTAGNMGDSHILPDDIIRHLSFDISWKSLFDCFGVCLFSLPGGGTPSTASWRSRSDVSVTCGPGPTSDSTERTWRPTRPPTRPSYWARTRRTRTPSDTFRCCSVQDKHLV